MGKRPSYPNIDLYRTGLNLKNLAVKNNYTVKDIQSYLELSCPQPIYRWYKGKMLPSVDHLYSLSLLFGVHMEELLVINQKNKKNTLLFHNYDNSIRLIV